MLNPLNYTSQGKPNILIQKLNTETFFTPGRYFKRHKSQSYIEQLLIQEFPINVDLPCVIEGGSEFNNYREL